MLLECLLQISQLTLAVNFDCVVIRLLARLSNLSRSDYRLFSASCRIFLLLCTSLVMLLSNISLVCCHSCTFEYAAFYQLNFLRLRFHTLLRIARTLNRLPTAIPNKIQLHSSFNLTKTRLFFQINRTSFPVHDLQTFRIKFDSTSFYISLNSPRMFFATFAAG